MEFLSTDEATCCSGDFFSDAQVDGVRGVWAELLILAWMHGEEAGLNRVARAVAAMSDREIRSLRKELGPFAESAHEIKELIQTAEMELGFDHPTLADLGRAAGVKPFDVKALRAFLKKEVARQRARDRRATAAAEKKRQYDGA
ncbi:MAG: hypothetical protein WCJ30_13180, partial [Deltaproteobacteria bacterium]